MCRLCGHRQTGEGQGRNATRGLRSHEKETAYHSACVSLSISNYLHTRVAFGAESLELHITRISWIFPLIIVNRASLFIFIIITRNVVFVILLYGTLISNFQIIIALFLKLARNYHICFQVFSAQFFEHFRYLILKENSSWGCKCINFLWTQKFIQDLKNVLEWKIILHSNDDWTLQNKEICKKYLMFCCSKVEKWCSLV